MAAQAPRNERIVLVFTHGPGVFAQLESGKTYRVVDGIFIDCITKPHQFPQHWE